MLSVIIPVYNCIKYLHRCVDSVLSQTCASYEIILVDDGSTDGSGDVCDQYVLRYNNVRVFHQTNKGASAARNLGIEKAVGEWITFCDDDDYVDKCWLQNFSDILDDSCDLVVQQIRFIGHEYKRIHGPNEIIVV